MPNRFQNMNYQNEQLSKQPNQKSILENQMVGVNGMMTDPINMYSNYMMEPNLMNATSLHDKLNQNMINGYKPNE